jgi:putative ABC transport system permease protein
VFEDDRANSWSFPHFTTLALLHSNADLNETVKKIQAVIKKNSPNFILTILLTHLTDIHFVDRPSISKHLFIFGTATLIILLLACINSMNLFTARSSTRTGEVGIKKVVGAHRRHLITQFLGESTLISFLSLGIALLIIQIVLPIFVLLVGRELHVESLGNLKLSTGLLAITLAVAPLSGAYPALVFSGLSPMELFKRKHLAKTSRSFLRKALVMFQFAVLVIMISGTLYISKQLRFIKTSNLGYDPQDIVVIRLGYDPRLKEFNDVIDEKILKGSGILSATRHSFIPPNFGSYIEISKGANFDHDRLKSKYMWVDENFLNTYGISLVEGRNFHKGSKIDEEETVLINEAAAKQLNLEFASGEQIYTIFSNSNEQKIVIGVMKDFHTGTLHGGIEPLVFRLLPHSGFYYSVKIRPNRWSEAYDHIQSVWEEFLPDRPLEYFLVKEEIERAYETENRLGLLSFVFSAIAIIISCLGLYGLAVFSAEQRKKEMGVRRILGASIKDLIAIMLKEFASPVVLAMAIAFPVAYWIMQNWLKNFAYRINMAMWPLLMSGFLALGIALLTVSHQAIRAATANPVESLRYE